MISAGDIYQIGNDVMKDTGKALYWYTEADLSLHETADSGDKQSEVALCECKFKGYDLSGHGPLQDYSDAIKWCIVAAQNDDVIAEENLSDMYRLGLGVKRDMDAAYMWKNRADKHFKFSPF